MQTDNKVKQLLKTVNLKKQEIKDAEHPNWKTNCNFQFDATNRLNLQVATEDQILKAYSVLLAAKHWHELAAKALNVVVPFKYNSYTFEAWHSDFTTRLNKSKIAEKRVELEALEARLNAVISPELRAQMEIEAIENALK